MLVDFVLKYLIVFQIIAINIYIIYWFLSRARKERYNKFISVEQPNQIEKNYERIRNDIRSLLNQFEKQDIGSFIRNLNNFDDNYKRSYMIQEELTHSMYKFEKMQSSLFNTFIDKIDKIKIPDENKFGVSSEDKIKYLSTIISDISHSLKTTISGLKISVQLLIDKHDDKYSQRIEEIKSSIKLLEDTIEGYSLLGLKNLSQSKSKVAFKDRLESLCHILSLSFDKKINLSFNIEDNIKISDDHFKILKIPITCILENSFAAIADNGIVKITVTKNVNKYTIDIYNNGPLIDVAPTRLFERGYSTKNSNGIGLSIAEKVISRFIDGKIRFSNIKDKGVSFYLDFQGELNGK